MAAGKPAEESSPRRSAQDRREGQNERDRRQNRLQQSGSRAKSLLRRRDENEDEMHVAQANDEHGGHVSIEAMVLDEGVRQSSTNYNPITAISDQVKLTGPARRQPWIYPNSEACDMQGETTEAIQLNVRPGEF